MGDWELYKRPPAVVLGFHGCDAETGEALLDGSLRHLSPSQNDYDWLGSGIYFWEGSPARAAEFAEAAHSRNSKLSKGKIRRPFVIGAVLHLGNCCNLLDFGALSELTEAYAVLQKGFARSGMALPQNRGPNRALRFLDRAVIETMHQLREEQIIHTHAPGGYDSVRAAFFEGDDLYPGAGFASKIHIQVAIRKLDCILGYFRPIQS